MQDLVTELYESDKTSELTNRAAREIERLRVENERLRVENERLEFESNIVTFGF